MSDAGFVLDPRLEADTHPVTSLPLCDLLLMNDARYPWLILVPRRADLVEITDLDAGEQATLWQEVNRTTAALRAVAPCDKLNLGALGNIVRQLHVHLVARHVGDAAWPGPVWGHGHTQHYNDAEWKRLIESLRAAIGPRVPPP
ncbi:HIT family protein [Rhodanobacter panaciterrae]|uniref:HIT family protein n=1 Tax=Rhodanobacter panaciterrae TaxID=490572 RepID=A0ABQ2ZTZ0_9GAMM|nr:HIT family protein [Rhodanobacter panaciterrae]GGY22612.1 HIT family protein [Rhodanobacter panaciterrae]